MVLPYRFLLLSLIFVVLGMAWGCQSKSTISYNRDIRPIFNKHCLVCHGGIKESGGFSLLFEEDAFAETESGRPAIVRGHAAKSELVKRLHDSDPELRMPFEKAPLAESEIKIIEQWIDEGARWEKHWAYVPPNPSIDPPKNLGNNWPQNEIDLFIQQQWLPAGLEPNPPADPVRLLRRLSLDLIGLPPSPQEMQAFLEDPTDDAYARQVDRLLASPHFGERWASMWLDLARYADSKGYEKDLYRSIWKYRDWVIQAFNDNMPFDQFTIEQLAGDLLDDPTESQLIATAFHRNTMANDEGGTDNEEFRNYANIERVGTTFEVWQGTTMSCVQCHSHPYDPFRQDEFYQFMALFNNTADRDIYHEGPNVFTYEGSAQKRVEQLISKITAQLLPEEQKTLTGQLHNRKQALLEYLDYHKIEAEHFDESSSFIELLAPNQDALFQIQDTSWIRFDNIDLTDVRNIEFRYVSPFGGFIEARLGAQNGKVIGELKLPPTAKKNEKRRWEKWRNITMSITEVQGPKTLYFVFKKDKFRDSDLFRLDWFQLHHHDPLFAKYGKNIYHDLVELSSILPIPTPIMQDLPPSKRRKTYVFNRGNWLSPGTEVRANIPAILGQLPSDEEVDRLDMARWLVSTKNPLTARVMVNRFWEQIFGLGIVETLEDFGTQSIPPSHPELLDWLALQFAGSWQWSVKRLLREIVLSATYRQSTEVDSIKLAKDSRNLLLSRGPRVRLSAEQVRDQILFVSDLLNPKIFGPSVRPPYPDGTAQFRFGDVYQVSGLEDQRRRSLYTYHKRTNPFPNQITFDGTDRTYCSSRRIRTNTPLQALALLNDPAYLEAAQNLAVYMEKYPATSVAEKIAGGYQKIMLRKIDGKKLESLLELWKNIKDQENSEDLLKGYALVANAILNLDEFINK